MLFGLTESEHKLVVNKIAMQLQKLGAKVYVYGSRARGDHKKFSDLDLMVESENDLSSQIEAIREEFQKSNFPIKIDLVDFKTFAESYKQNYLNERKPLV